MDYNLNHKYVDYAVDERRADCDLCGSLSNETLGGSNVEPSPNDGRPD